MPKTPLLIAIAIVLGIGIVGAVAYGFTRSNTAQTATTATPTPAPEKFNTIPVNERPYVTISPNTSGRNLTITLHDVKKPARDGEYEIEYQSGNLLQGAFGQFKLNNLPNTQDVLLGSCSAGGKCSYHEDVSGGSLLLRFKGDEKYVLKNEWSFIENSAKQDTFSSRDGKFGASGPGLKAIPYAVVYQTPGYPAIPADLLQAKTTASDQSALDSMAEVVSLPYSIGVAKPATGNVEISVRLNEDRSAATILAWDGTKWHSLTTKVTDKVATATANKWYEAYLAIATATTNDSSESVE